MSNKLAVVVLPTYNEKQNIKRMLKAILSQQPKIKNYQLEVLVVDDSSPDGTAKIVRQFMKENAQVHLLGEGKKEGLGVAYIRGFQYAYNQLKAEVVFEMDADFSHDPNDIPRLLAALTNKYDFIIGSRYVPGGSIPADWGLLRKAISKFGNIFARYIAGLGGVKDCTGGFRAIRTSAIRRVNVETLEVKGYAFQVSFLHRIIRSGARVGEVPIQFTDRVFGQSKLGSKDVREFMLNCVYIRFPGLRSVGNWFNNFSLTFAK